MQNSNSTQLKKDDFLDFISSPKDSQLQNQNPDLSLKELEFQQMNRVKTLFTMEKVAVNGKF